MNITPGDISKIAAKMQKNGNKLMSTALTMLVLSQMKTLVEDVTKDVEPVLAQFTVVDAKAANATYKLNSDPTVAKLSKLEQYSKSIITLIAENRQTASMGAQLQTDIGQLPPSNSFYDEHEKINKEIRDLVTTLNASITDIMTKVKAGNITRDQVKQGLDAIKDIGKKIDASQMRIDKTLLAEHTAVDKLTPIAARAKEIVSSTSTLSTSAANVPKLDE